MSPARSKRQPIPHRRSRSEIGKAVAVAAGSVVVTAIVIWLMRPGAAGTVGTGGMINRQPRVSWLVGVALGVGGLATWFILRFSRRARGHEKTAVPIALGVVLVAAVIGGFAWPGGLLRHDHAPPKLTTPSTTAPGSTTTTVAGATTTTVAGATTTTVAGATTTTAAGATTTTAAGATTSTPTTLPASTTSAPTTTGK
jgi:hypothetical protein